MWSLSRVGFATLTVLAMAPAALLLGCSPAGQDAVSPGGSATATVAQPVPVAAPPNPELAPDSLLISPMPIPTPVSLPLPTSAPEPSSNVPEQPAPILRQERRPQPGATPLPDGQGRGLASNIDPAPSPVLPDSVAVAPTVEPAPSPAEGPGPVAARRHAPAYRHGLAHPVRPRLRRLPYPHLLPPRHRRRRLRLFLRPHQPQFQPRPRPRPQQPLQRPNRCPAGSW